MFIIFVYNAYFAINIKYIVSISIIKINSSILTYLFFIFIIFIILFAMPFGTTVPSLIKVLSFCQIFKCNLNSGNVGTF